MMKKGKGKGRGRGRINVGVIVQLLWPMDHTCYQDERANTGGMFLKYENTKERERRKRLKQGVKAKREKKAVKEVEQ